MLSDWLQLADSLNLPSYLTIPLTRQLNFGSITYYKVLRSILSSWKSRVGEAATVESLCDTLENLGFIYIKGFTLFLLRTKKIKYQIALISYNSN